MQCVPDKEDGFTEPTVSMLRLDGTSEFLKAAHISPLSWIVAANRLKSTNVGRENATDPEHGRVVVYQVELSDPDNEDGEDNHDEEADDEESESESSEELSDDASAALRVRSLVVACKNSDKRASPSTSFPGNGLP